MNLPNYRTLVKSLTMQPETVKTLTVLGGLIVLACLLIWGLPILIVHVWNNFFHAIFGLPGMYYDNAVSFVFWLLLCVGLIFALKEVK